MLIRGARLIGPTGVDETADLRIEGDRIAAIGSDAKPTADDVVLDAEGCWVVPGLCDIHVHFREPGFEYKETIETGARAAARGGFTDVACMPNTNPTIDDLATVRLVVERWKAVGLTRVHPIAAVTVGMNGECLTEMAELHGAGAVAFSDDGLPVRDAGIMRRALEYASMVGVPIIDHCEDLSLSQGGVMHEGVVATQLGLRGVPAVAEEVMVARDLQLAQLTGGHVHLAHMSTAGSVDLIREAKKHDVRVTAEVTPHHLVLTDEAVRSYDPVTKVNPPLRTDPDVQALREALIDGTIDIIATDHAPHSVTEKEYEYDRAPCGLIGLETALGLVLTELVHPGLLTPQRLVQAMSYEPRRIVGLPALELAVGEPADLTIIDPAREWVVDPRTFASRSSNSPFAGRRLRGEAAWTIVGGTVVYAAHETEVTPV